MKHKAWAATLLLLSPPVALVQRNECDRHGNVLAGETNTDWEFDTARLEQNLSRTIWVVRVEETFAKFGNIYLVFY